MANGFVSKIFFYEKGDATEVEAISHPYNILRSQKIHFIQGRRGAQALFMSSEVLMVRGRK